MADWSATGVWEKGGALASLRDLPIDPDSFFELGVWQHWFESRHSDDPVKNLDRFVAYGWRIVWNISRQLPDWTIVYHDEKTGENLIGMKLWLRRSE